MEMEGEKNSSLVRESYYNLSIKVTCYPMPVLNLLELGLILEAVFTTMLATTGKGAAWRQIQGTGDFALYGLDLFAGTEINLKDSLH